MLVSLWRNALWTCSTTAAKAVRSKPSQSQLSAAIGAEWSAVVVTPWTRTRCLHGLQPTQTCGSGNLDATNWVRKASEFMYKVAISMVSSQVSVSASCRNILGPFAKPVLRIEYLDEWGDPLTAPRLHE